METYRIPIVLTFAVIFFLPTATPQLTEQYFLEPSVVLVEEWEGWGTSLAWWADMLGGMTDDVMNLVTDAFFNPDNLNFNIVRYVIGGTTPESVTPYPCGPYRPGSASESFKDGPDSDYDWSRDVRQIAILNKSISMGANILEAFSNSPPQWMTISGCAKGNYLRFPLHDNFDPSQAAAFAEYATDVIQHFKNELGITFQYYAPFNEPFGLAGIGSWFGWDASQEGCNMNRSTMAEVLRQVDAALTRKEMDYITITGADETQINTAVETANYFLSGDVNVANLMSKWNVHGYWDDPRVPSNRRDLLNIISHQGGQKLWMDEMGWGSTPPNDMTQALDISKRILSDLKYMMPSAWLYWQAMESTGEWGLVSVPYRFNATLDEVEFNSGYYAMMQFSKYIRQGYQLIFISDGESVAAYDKNSSTVVIVTVHQADTTVTKSFDLSRFSGNLSIPSVTRTSSTQQHATITSQAKLWVRKVTLTMTPASVTTIVISGAFYSDTESLIVNGNFETFGGFSWSVTQNGSANGNEFPWRGNIHGFLPASDDYLHENVLSQDVTVPTKPNIHSTQLFLTLFASTKGADTSVEAWISGKKVAQTKLDHRPSYRAYGITFPASGNDNVNIRVRSGSGHGPVYVDNVVLYYAHSDASGNYGRIVRNSMILLSLSIFLPILFRSLVE